MESWKFIAGYKDYYEVSDTGKVRNSTNGNELKPSDNGQCLQVTLSNNGVHKSYKVHRLVAEAFIHNDNPADKIQVNHIDNDRFNNNASNLEWATPSENTLHAYVNGHNSRSRVVHQFDDDGYVASFYSTREAERSTGIACTSIAAVARGERKSAGGFDWSYSVPRERVFMNFALSLAGLSKCEQRGVAAIITDKELMQVYSIGINGGPKGLQDCLCKVFEKYGCIHAESQALSKCLSDAADKVMFVTLSPCVTCAAAIINAPGGFSVVYYHEEWKDDSGLKLLRAAGIKTIKI